MKTTRLELSETELNHIHVALVQRLSRLDHGPADMKDSISETEVLIDKIENLISDMSKPQIHVWDRKKIQSLKEGDLAPDAFGRLKKVKEIQYRRDDVNGLAFVGYTVEFGPNSTISNSMKEGRILRTVELSKYYTSAQIDAMENLAKSTF